MELKDILTKVPTVSKNATIKDLISVFSKNKTDFACVVEADNVVGVVSEKDLIKLIKIQPIPSVSVLSKGIPKNILQRNVWEIMTSNPIMIRSSSSMEHALETMVVNNLKRIVVVDENRRLVGIAKIRDILEKL